MGVEGYCSCTKDIGEKILTFQNTNDNKDIPNTESKKTRMNLYDNFFNNSINLKTSNVFSINSNNNIESSRKWQNCVPQKNTNEIFIGRARSYNNNIESNNNTEKSCNNLKMVY